VKQTTIGFRASPVLVARIGQLAEARRCTRSAAIKAAILEATTPEHATGVPDEQEVLVLLGQAARGGNVAAMRELLAYHRERKRPTDNGVFAGVDDLATRRQQPAQAS
jgi:hypothetical protein